LAEIAKAGEGILYKNGDVDDLENSFRMIAQQNLNYSLIKHS